MAVHILQKSASLSPSGMQEKTSLSSGMATAARRSRFSPSASMSMPTGTSATAHATYLPEWETLKWTLSPTARGLPLGSTLTTAS